MLYYIFGAPLVIAGFILFLIGSIGLLVAEFKAHILWGLTCLLFQIGHFIFVILYFDRAKRWLKYMLGGMLLLFIGTLILQAGTAIAQA